MIRIYFLLGFLFFTGVGTGYSRSQAQKSPRIAIFPPQIHQQITPESAISRSLQVFNTGDMPLDFTCRFEPWGVERAFAGAAGNGISSRDTTVSWVYAEPMSGQVLPNDTTEIVFYFNSAGLTIANYYINFIISSNDPDNPELEVLAMLHVMDLSIYITPGQDSLCEGDSTQLALAIFGGTENYTYEWTSNPPGFYSTEKEPFVHPARNTFYIVEVTDGGYSRKDSILIKATPLPEKPVILSGPSTVDITGVTSSEFNASSIFGAISYRWEVSPANAGSCSGNGITGTVTWSPGFTGTASVTVAAENNCGWGDASDAHQVTVYNPSGLEEIQPALTLSVHPNPAKGHLILSLYADHEYQALVSIRSLTGMVCLEQQLALKAGLNEILMTTSGLPPGFYLLMVKSTGPLHSGFVHTEKLLLF